MGKAWSITAAELAALDKENKDLPAELVSSSHLIYSSPATLAFNSPGANGYGVKRAGLAVPGSVMLLVSPGCCGRNVTSLGPTGEYADRFFYLLLDDTDIVTGRHLTKIPEAVEEVCDSCDVPPSAVMICITCVDALLGTDMDRVCRQCAERTGIPAVPCYMYALTREKRLHPMAAVRQAVYSLLKPLPRRGDAVNILGFFAPLNDGSEIYRLLRDAGVRTVREIGRCQTYGDYQAMAQANFNLVLNPEARHAAQEMEKNLGIPSIELMRLYQLDKIQNQYRLLGQAIGAGFDDQADYDRAQAAIDAFKERHGARHFAVGEILNADSFELSLALLRSGFNVDAIYGTVGELNRIFIRRIAELSPHTRIYSNLSPTMLWYDGSESAVDTVLGADAIYYHPGCPGVEWNDEVQPFGYDGVSRLFEELDAALTQKEV